MASGTVSAAVDAPSPLERELERERDQALNEASASSRALAEVKRDFAMARLRWFANNVRAVVAKNIKADPPLQDVRATVRFAVYEDLTLAKDVVAVLQRCTHWPVALDSDNKPLIEPDHDFKIVFDIGPGGAFREVFEAFEYGALVKGKIERKLGERWDEMEHLVVDVLPTIKP